MRLSGAMLLLGLLVGCNATSPGKQISQKVLDTLAVCNAGYRIALNAGLTSSLNNLIVDGASISWSTSSEIRGLLLNSDAVDKGNIEEMYRSYLSCVRSERSTDELLAILDQRSDEVRNLLEDNDRSDVIPDFDNAYLRYVTHLRANERVAAHEAVRSIYRILARTEFEIRQSTGLSIKFEFSKDNDRTKDLMKQAANKEAEDNRKDSEVRECVDLLKSTALNGDLFVDVSLICDQVSSETLLEYNPCANPQSIEQMNKCIRGDTPFLGEK